MPWAHCGESFGRDGDFPRRGERCARAHGEYFEPVVAGHRNEVIPACSAVRMASAVGAEIATMREAPSTA
ncbi:MAG: hypothetical protein ACXWVR_04575, partial [Rhodoplanes sp.]